MVGWQPGAEVHWVAKSWTRLKRLTNKKQGTEATKGF